MSIEWDLAEQLAALRAKILRGEVHRWNVNRIIAALQPELHLIAQVEPPITHCKPPRTLTRVK